MNHKCIWMGIMHFLKTIWTKESQGFQNLAMIHSDSRLKEMVFFQICEVHGLATILNMV